MVFILGGVSVFAYGTSSLSLFGHSSDELNLNTGINENVGISVNNPQKN